MNVSVSRNSYYFNKSQNTTVQLITAGDAADCELLPELAPTEIVVKSKLRVCSKTVFELDGVEFNPVDMLFQPHPPTPEEKWKVKMKDRGQQFKSKFAKFKELNEQMVVQNESNPLELDINFRRTIQGWKRKPRKLASTVDDSDSDSCEEIQDLASTISRSKRNSSGSSIFSATASDSSNSSNSSAESLPQTKAGSAKPSEQQSKPEDSDADPANNFSQMIWNTFTYYWDAAKNQNQETKSTVSQSEEENAEVIVTKKVYTTGKNGQLRLTSTTIQKQEVKQDAFQQNSCDKSESFWSNIKQKIGIIKENIA